MRNRAVTILYHLAFTAATAALLAFAGTHIHRALTLDPGILME